MKGKHILVTGANGFIGRHLARSLIKKGAKLYCIDNHPHWIADSNPSFDQQSINVDVNSPRFMNVFLRKRVDLIFHFGAPCSVIQFNENPSESISNTVNGMRNVLGLAEITGAKLIYPSSGNVYGSTRVQSDWGVPQPNNSYGLSKLACEYMATLVSNIDSVGLRIFAGYGPGEERKGRLASVVTLFIQDMLSNRAPVVWGDGSQTRDFIYIDDVIHGIIVAAECKERVGVVNLGTGVATSFNELIFEMGEVLGKHIVPTYVEKAAAYVENTKADTFLMDKYLGEWSKVSLREGIRRTVEWLSWR